MDGYGLGDGNGQEQNGALNHHNQREFFEY